MAFTRAAALAGIGVVLADAVLVPARMAGELSGALDPDLLRLAFLSAGGAACLLRVGGLALIAARPGGRASLAGGLLTLVSFLLVGHTTTHEPRWLLCALLALHLAGVMFWVGSLEPLIHVLKDETAVRAGVVLELFSKVAGWVVTGLFAAAVGLATALLPGVAGLARPYGALLLTKLAGFACLLLLASLNRWRLAPAVAQGVPGATAVLARVIRVEQVLIAVVLVATSVMTTWFSPAD
jgi:putative copper resistance protein D